MRRSIGEWPEEASALAHDQRVRVLLSPTGLQLTSFSSSGMRRALTERSKYLPRTRLPPTLDDASAAGREDRHAPHAAPAQHAAPFEYPRRPSYDIHSPREQRASPLVNSGEPICTGAGSYDLAQGQRTEVVAGAAVLSRTISVSRILASRVEAGAFSPISIRTALAPSAKKS